MTMEGHHHGGPFGSAAASWAHYSDLEMYARRVLGDRSDAAEDVVQEAYLRLLGLAASDQAPASARPWLFRVVRNLAIDERRSAARRADPVADATILGTSAPDDTAALVEQRDELTDALRGIAALPPRERRAIEMDQAGIGAQQIATELGTTPNAVHQALFRARRRLRGARAVAWGLIPVGLVPVMLRAADPAMAVSLGNLPPGVPVGRALPVAGVVAAAMVGGSVVAPSFDPAPATGEGIQFALPTVTLAQAAGGDTSGPTTTSGSSSGRGSGTSDESSDDNSGPGSRNSGPGNADDRDDDDGTDRADRDDDDDNSGPGSRNSGSGKDDDRAEDRADDREKRTEDRSGRGGDDTRTRTSTRADDDRDAPDEPDEPDDD